MPTTPDPNPEIPHPAVIRLEEHAAHTERSIEALSGEIAELNRRMKRLADRLASIEQRIVRIASESSESPDSIPDSPPTNQTC